MNEAMGNVTPVVASVGKMRRPCVIVALGTSLYTLAVAPCVYGVDHVVTMVSAGSPQL